MNAPLSAIYFVVPVWGEDYVKLFTEICLPAQLAPGNIPSLPNIGRCQYHIYTTQEDYQGVYQSPAFKRLEQLINASIHTIQAPKSSNERYDKKSEIYRAAIRRASKDDAVNFFLNADIVLADGFIRRTVELLKAGKRVIELPGPRTAKEAMRRELLPRIDEDGAIVVSPRELTSLSIRHLHPLEKMHFWEAQAGEDRFHPSHLYWRVGKDSLLARCIHLYPIVVHPRDRIGAVQFDTTIDDDLVQRACPAMEDTHVVTDSDEMFCAELSAAEHFVGNMGARGDIESVVDFMFTNGKERNVKLLKHQIRMVGGDEPEAAWQRAEAEAEKVIGAVINRGGLTAIYEDKGSSATAQGALVQKAAAKAAPAKDGEAKAPKRKTKKATGEAQRHIGKPKVRMLVAVWGEHHSSLFLDYALPSLLAPGNIPALVEHFDCDFEFLTLIDDVERLKKSPSVKMLERYARVHYTEIDDLAFRHSYGILLTFAFARGIAARRDEMTDTTFVFLNADFVFSDGSLRSMLKALQDGYNAVVVPSFRCISEEFTTQMRRRFDRDKGGEAVLSLSARGLVQTALDLIHPTFAAKTVNQDGPYTTLVNQFLWKADEHTMVGRFYLLFMLCVRPEVPLDEVIGFCDYTLVPQLVPSGKVKIFTDSDDVFLLELQNRAHEGGEHIVPQRPSMEFLAECLAEWTTPMHRHYAAQDLVFHSREVPKALRKTTDEAKKFIDDVTSRLGPPRPYQKHEHWTGTLAALNVDPDAIPLLSRRSGMSGDRTEAPPVAVTVPKKIKKIAKKKKFAGALKDWSEGVERTVTGQRVALANLRDIRDRLSGKLAELHLEAADLRDRQKRLEAELGRAKERQAAAAAARQPAPSPPEPAAQAGYSRDNPDTQAAECNPILSNAYVPLAPAHVVNSENFADPSTMANYLMQTVPHWLESVVEDRQQFDELWAVYSASHGKPWDPIRILQFMYMMKIANAAPEGEYGEFGSHQGFMTRVIHKLMDPARTLYSFDTFEGFTKQDIEIEKQIYANDWHEGNFLPTSPESVANYVGDGQPPANFKPVKGWFPESFKGYEDIKWRFIHIDFDLYQPIKSGLEILWPRIVPGGVCIVHDYGCFGFPGAKKAVDEFFDSIGLTPMHLGDRWGSVGIVKPKR